MYIRMFLSVAAIACAFLSATGEAGEVHKVSQKGKLFTPTNVEITRGDTVVFVNDDVITHNVFARGGSKDFNTGALKPGDSKEITFDAGGRAEVKCAIHPLMKLNVTVK